jgi:hypothetical protein
MTEVAKKIILAFIITLTYSFSVNAQESKNKETGKIYFLRSTGIPGSGSAFKMFIDDKFVCKLNNKKYSVHEVAVGKHSCFVKGGRNKPKESAEKFEVQVEAGKITYVQLIYEIDIFKYYLYFEEVTEEIASKNIEKMSEDTECL